jgi:hypothetical protein
MATKTTPLTVEAITAGTIIVTDPKAGMQYSLNGGAKTAVSGDISVSAGDKVAFYGNGTSITSYDGTKIVGGTADIKMYGNIMSLVDETGFAANTTLTAIYTFRRLFYGNEKLTDASGLLLPATTLKANCYDGMFENCTNLAAASKELPAPTLAFSCYAYMFYDCKALTETPKLPATALAIDCYRYMFKGCKALTETPKLPATTLASGCYTGMFLECTGLTTAYVKAGYKKSSQCGEMFTNCTNAATSTFYSDDAASWKSNFSASLSNWQTAAYPTE